MASLFVNDNKGLGFTFNMPQANVQKPDKQVFNSI